MSVAGASELPLRTGKKSAYSAWSAVKKISPPTQRQVLTSSCARCRTPEVSDGDEPPLTLEFTLSATAHPRSLHRLCWAVVHSVMCSVSHAFLAATQRG